MTQLTPPSAKDDIDEMMALLHDIHAQNIALGQKIDTQTEHIEQLEKTATKRGAIAGAVAGSVSGGVVAVGVELIRAKLGF